MRCNGALRTRVLMVLAAGCFLAVALVLRKFTGDGHGGGNVPQFSGTALYASMVYAGVLFLWPRMAPLRAGLIAVTFCWLVETAQLTGIPAQLSERNILARVALGIQFDWTDMLWYPIGIIPLVVIDHYMAARARMGREPLP